MRVNGTSNWYSGGSTLVGFFDFGLGLDFVTLASELMGESVLLKVLPLLVLRAPSVVVFERGVGGVCSVRPCMPTAEYP